MATSRLNLWMDVMRHVEPIADDYERLFDAWAAGGVDGLVIGPLVFEGGAATFDPDPAIYRKFGVEAPEGPAEQLPQKRLRFERALRAAKDRGWKVWIFQPAQGGRPAPDARGSVIVDQRAREAYMARLVDAMQHYPMADGAVMDGPEWGYEISEEHMVGPHGARSYIFDELKPTDAPACAELGYDYDALVAAKDRLFARLHALTDRDVALHGRRAGGLLGAFQLLGGDPNLLDWIAFRRDALTNCFASFRALIEANADRSYLLAEGPRTAAFGLLCGYDVERLAGILDVLLPKHYFWHRGFDGLYGTVARYVETLRKWNPGLGERAALDVVGALFGIDLPDVTGLADFDAGFAPAFFEQVVVRETERAIAATGDPGRIVPWIDAGRRPHEGDPITAGDLGRILDAAAGAGMRRFIYHHHENLTPGEWSAISARCGTPWLTTAQPPLASDLTRNTGAIKGYYPPDLPVL